MILSNLQVFSIFQSIIYLFLNIWFSCDFLKPALHYITASIEQHEQSQLIPILNSTKTSDLEIKDSPKKKKKILDTKDWSMEHKNLG